MGRGPSVAGGTRAKERTGNKRQQDLGTALRGVSILFIYVLPQVAFVGGVLDVVTDVVVHSMGCCAVSSIKNLELKTRNQNQFYVF